MNQTSSPAAQLKPHQRQQIALRVLTKQETIKRGVVLPASYTKMALSVDISS
jgi:hypothetical protein